MQDIELVVLEQQERIEELEHDNELLTAALDRTQSSLGRMVLLMIEIKKMIDEVGGK